MTAFNVESRYKFGNLVFRDKSRSPQQDASLWDRCPVLPGVSNPHTLFEHFEDFVGFPGTVATTTLAGYTVTQATTGAVSLGVGAEGGTLLVDSNSVTQGQGLNVQYSIAQFKPAADKDIWFEARVKVVDTFDDAELFIGLAELDTTIIATQAVSTANHIGFSCVTNDGVLLFNGEKAGAGATVASVTLEEDTWIKLGFHVSGVTLAEQYVDDSKQSTTLATANIPIVALAPSFVCQSGGTADPILHVDYFRCIQLR